MLQNKAPATICQSLLIRARDVAKRPGDVCPARTGVERRKGYADFIFKPRANAGWRPAMVVELKYNKSADTAIKQIKEKRYQGALSDYNDKILLVGINYDAEGKDSKKHTCVIEEWKD